VFAFAAIHPLRAAFLERAGVIVYPDGYATLDVGCSPRSSNASDKVDRLPQAREIFRHIKV